MESVIDQIQNAVSGEITHRVVERFVDFRLIVFKMFKPFNLIAHTNEYRCFRVRCRQERSLERRRAVICVLFVKELPQPIYFIR